MICPVLNRGNARDLLFEKDADDAAFEKMLAQTQEQIFVRVLGDCLLPNHWPLVLWPLQEGDLGRFMPRLTTTQVRRWPLNHRTVGTGHLYRGTDKSFPVAAGEHLSTVLRSVERNPVRPTLVDHAAAWRWSSLWCWEQPVALEFPFEHREQPVLCPWPLPRPTNWITRVNRPLTKMEQEAVRASVTRGRPFGNEAWQENIVRQLGLESPFRPRGRPRKTQD